MVMLEYTNKDGKVVLYKIPSLSNVVVGENAWRFHTGFQYARIEFKDSVHAREAMRSCTEDKNASVSYEMPGIGWKEEKPAPVKEEVVEEVIDLEKVIVVEPDIIKENSNVPKEEVVEETVKEIVEAPKAKRSKKKKNKK